MSGTIDALNGKLEDLLQPLVTGQDLKGVHFTFFDGSDKMSDLLAKYRDQMPGVFLCPSVITFAAGQASGGPLRTTDATCRYLLLMGIPSRAQADARIPGDATLIDLVLGALVLADIPRSGLPTHGAAPDFLRLVRAEYAALEVMSVVLVEFTVNLRNWKP